MDAAIKKETEEKVEVIDVLTEDDRVVRLEKPFEWEGTTYTSFILDFDKLKGNDFIKIEHEMNMDNEWTLSPESSASFCIRLAAKAANVNVAVFFNLPLKEFNKIKNKARNFLLVLA